MQAMTVRGSPAVRYLTAAVAITIVVFGLKYSSDFPASILFAATLAILFTPALWWPEKKACPYGWRCRCWFLGGSSSS
jgi:predicted PurR-regulated permease PerM